MDNLDFELCDLSGNLYYYGDNGTYWITETKRGHEMQRCIAVLAYNNQSPRVVSC